LTRRLFFSSGLRAGLFVFLYFFCHTTLAIISWSQSLKFSNIYRLPFQKWLSLNALLWICVSGQNCRIDRLKKITETMNKESHRHISETAAIRALIVLGASATGERLLKALRETI